MLSYLLELLMPTVCVLCGASCCTCLAEKQLRSCSKDLCPSFDCSLAAPPDFCSDSDTTGWPCSSCGEYFTAWSSALQLRPLCMPCALAPLPTGMLRSAYRYVGPTELLVKRLKYGHKLNVAHIIAELMLNRAEISSERSWHLIVPLPSATSATRTRGFSPSALIACKLSRRLKIGWDPLAVRSRRPRVQQASLPPHRRFANVVGAFSVVSARVSGKRILLVDDMITTGSSMASAAQALIEAGASSVDGWTFARSSSFQRNRTVRDHSTKANSLELPCATT